MSAADVGNIHASLGDRGLAGHSSLTSSRTIACIFHVQYAPQRAAFVQRASKTSILCSFLHDSSKKLLVKYPLLVAM